MKTIDYVAASLDSFIADSNDGVERIDQVHTCPSANTCPKPYTGTDAPVLTTAVVTRNHQGLN